MGISLPVAQSRVVQSFAVVALEAKEPATARIVASERM